MPNKPRGLTSVLRVLLFIIILHETLIYLDATVRMKLFSSLKAIINFDFFRYPKKRMISIETIECTSRASFVLTECDLKRIGPSNLKFNLNISLSRPVNDVWLHSQYFYKINNKFQKVPVDLWEGK